MKINGPIILWKPGLLTLFLLKLTSNQESMFGKHAIYIISFFWCVTFNQVLNFTFSCNTFFRNLNFLRISYFFWLKTHPRILNNRQPTSNLSHLQRSLNALIFLSPDILLFTTLFCFPKYFCPLPIILCSQLLCNRVKNVNKSGVITHWATIIRNSPFKIYQKEL